MSKPSIPTGRVTPREDLTMPGETLTATAEIAAERDRPRTAGAPLTVWTRWASDARTLDRPDAIGICCEEGHAVRLARAIDDGAVHPDPKVVTDVHGQTYVQAPARSCPATSTPTCARWGTGRRREVKDMKVRIGYTVDIDTEAWNADFGTEASDVREDIKSVLSTSQSSSSAWTGALSNDALPPTLRPSQPLGWLT